MMNEPLESLMIKNLVTLTPNQTVWAAQEIFDKFKFHHIPVVEGTKLVGMISISDIIKCCFKKTDTNKTLVKSVMTTKLAKLAKNDKIGSAAEIFLLNRFHAIPIVAGNGDLLGLITDFDVLKYSFKKEYPNHDF